MSKHDAHTFLEITSQVENLATDGRNEMVSYFFFGAIIAAHDNDELRFVRHIWGSEHGRCYEMGVDVLGNQAIELPYIN